MVVAGVFLVARLYPVFWEGFSIPDVSVNLIVVIAGDHDRHLGAAGVRPERHQEGARLLDGRPARLHDARPRRRRVAAGRVPHLHPRLLQVLPVPVRRLGEPLRLAPQLRHEEGHGRAGQEDADHRRRRGSSSALALAGVFPLAGFFSKDEIIDNVGHNGYTVFMWIALVGAFLTAAYTVRATYLTFFGEPRGAAAGGTDHDELGAELSTHDVAPRRPAGGRARARARRARRPRGARRRHGARRARRPRRARPARVAEADPDPDLHPRRPRRRRRLHQRHAVRRGVGELRGVRRAAPEAVADVEPRRRGRGRRRGTALPADEEGGEDAAGRGGARRRAAGHEARSRHGLLLPGRQPRRVHVVARPRCRSPSSPPACVVELVRLRRAVHPARPPPRRAHRALPPGPGRLHVPRQQVLPRRPLRERHRPGHRPPDRQGRVLDQPARHRRHRQRRRRGRHARSAAGSTATSTSGSSTAPSTAPGTVANETGHALQPVQSGKVNQYGALLFGAAAVGAIVLVIVNV